MNSADNSFHRISLEEKLKIKELRKFIYDLNNITQKSVDGKNCIL